MIHLCFNSSKVQFERCLFDVLRSVLFKVSIPVRCNSNDIPSSKDLYLRSFNSSKVQFEREYTQFTISQIRRFNSSKVQFEPKNHTNTD